MKQYGTLPERLVPFNFSAVPSAGRDEPLAQSVLPQ